MKLIVALTAAALIAGSALSAKPVCRNEKGKFIKCHAAAVSTPANTVKDAKGKCHFASGPKKGQFTTCK